MWLIGLLTFALPWVFTNGTPNPFLEAKEVLLIAGGWGLILWTALAQPVLPSQGIRNPFLGWVALYALAMGLLHFQWKYLWRTIHQVEIVYNVYTWLPTLAFLMALLLMRTLALHWFQHPPNLIQLTQWLCLSGALVACYAIGQQFKLDQWFLARPNIGNTWKGVYAGFGNPSYLAIYLASLLPLCLLFKPKRYLLYFVVMLIALALTQIRYAWGLAGIGLLSYGVSRWWRTWTLWQRRGIGLGLLLLAIGAGVVAWSWTHGDERWKIWQQSWALLLQSSPNHSARSWTGYGLGAYELLSRETSFKWAHNEWLQALIEVGILGTGLCLLAIGWATKRAWQQSTRSLLDAGWFGVWMTLLAVSLIHFPFHLAPLIWTGLCAWAVIERDQGEVRYG